MEPIEIEFTYSVPDDFLEQTDNLKRTVTRKRHFEHRYWGFYIAKESCTSGFRELSKGEIFGFLGPVDQNTFDNDHIEKDDYKPIIVDASIDPLIVDLCYPPKNMNYNDPLQYKQYIVNLPDGLVYTRPDISDLPTHLAYALDTLQYDLENKKWNKPGYLKNWSSWEMLSEMASQEIKFAEEQINNLDIDTPLYKKWVAFKEEMVNKVELYKKHNIKPIECVFSPHPKE